jgi:gluconolactonase
MLRSFLLPGLLTSLVLLGGCSDEAVAPSDAGSDGGAADVSFSDVGTSDGAPTDGASTEAAVDASFPDPLQGTGPATLVKGGFVFLEGPLWRATTADLLFNDLGVATPLTKKLVLPSTFTDFRTPSGAANGMALDPQKKLVVCEGYGAGVGGRRLSRENGATFATIVATYGGKKLNSPNDVIVRSDGMIWFTDPDYGVGGAKEQTFNGVYRVDLQNQITLVSDKLQLPNGIALSPDEKTLYVADNGAGKILAYPVAPDGTTGAPKDFAPVTAPDGITIDDAGNVYSSSSNGVQVFRPDGTKLGSIPVAEQPANVAFGGPDRKTLFITARTGLYSVKLNVPGPP